MEEHEFYDKDGEPCRSADAFKTIVTVTTESRWTDEVRGRAMRLQEYEDGMCPCGCGQQMTLAHDPSQPVVVDTWTCQFSRAVAQVRRQREKQAEDRNAGPGWDDGLRFYGRAPTPEELAATPPRKKPKQQDASVTKLDQVRRASGRRRNRGEGAQSGH